MMITIPRFQLVNAGDGTIRDNRWTGLYIRPGAARVAGDRDQNAERLQEIFDSFTALPILFSRARRTEIERDLSGQFGTALMGLWIRPLLIYVSVCP